jgi:hypothetical protein
LAISKLISLVANPVSSPELRQAYGQVSSKELSPAYGQVSSKELSQAYCRVPNRAAIGRLEGDDQVR